MDKDHKKVGKKPAQYKKYPAQYKEYGGSGKGVEDSETEYNPVDDIEAGDAEGSGKVKGPAGFNSYTDKNHQHPHSEGGGKKMGYAQTWGAARKSGAARGAAAVAKVLGAALPDPDESKKVKPLDKGDSYKPEGFKSDMGDFSEPVLKPKKNVATKIYQATDYSKRLPDTEIKVPTSSGGTRTNLVKNYETSNFGTEFSNVNQLKQGGFLKVPRNSGYSSGNPKNKTDRISMLNEFTDFMKQPTSSPRAVKQKLNEMQSGPKGGLMSDIKFYGGGKKKHGKKHHNKK